MLLDFPAVTISVQSEKRLGLRQGEVRVRHLADDPLGVNRFIVSWKDVEIELLPSKGLAVGQAHVLGRPMFWEPPLARLPDPAALDPRDPLLVNGSRTEGFGWIAAFSAGIEPLGLRNWGMPTREPHTGELLGLHGEAALIPVQEVTIHEAEGELELGASMTIRDLRGLPDLPWYDRGVPLLRMDRRVILRPGLPGVLLKDTITNLGDAPAAPDWGYHIQLRPLIGATFKMPSRAVHGRKGSPVAVDHERWHPAEKVRHRVERGFVHREMKVSPGYLDGMDAVRTLLRYHDGSGIEAAFPPSPYVLSWFSAGGAGGSEFEFPDEGRTGHGPLMARNWDGVGPEIGASALDHDRDVDPAVISRPLPPKGRLELRVQVQMLAPEGVTGLAREIDTYNRHRE